MVIPVYKPIGITTHVLAKKVGAIYGEKATHTGSLDPMAEGVVVVLTGEDRFDKTNASRVQKVYKFEILFGLQSDSVDVLGLGSITDQYSELVLMPELKAGLDSILSGFLGDQVQVLPKFSARRIAGRSYFDLAREKVEFEPASEKITIHSLTVISWRMVSIADLERNILDRIDKVQGNFRQAEIREQWVEVFCDLREKLGVEALPVVRMQAITSQRTYIRALVRDISEKLAVPALTYSIVRTRNGEYGVEDCVQVD
jgi:tRNA pseudouridine55 synthase